MKFNFFLIFVIVSLKLKYALAPEFVNLWVVWNVGQGQWVTHILPDTCLHYEMGGEFGSFKKIKKTLIFHCGIKNNKLSLSHWDYDHFLNIPSFIKSLPNLCWQHIPEIGEHKKIVQNILQLKISGCEGSIETLTIWIPKNARNTNESSMIFYEDHILMSGDSPIQQEKVWVNQIEKIELARILILGHHGSRTSTGKDLLAHLPQLKFSIASARNLKYGHPHAETLKRLAEFNIPILKTEDWGNIWFE